MATPILPGQGRVPYIPIQGLQPAYRGPVVVSRDEGIVVPTSYGQIIKLLCVENTGDSRFTVAERTYDAGSVVEVEQRDSEAIHILSGYGEFRAWPTNVPPTTPIFAPLIPGMEIVIDQFVRHEIRVVGKVPLVALVTSSHLDFPAYPHHYPAVFKAGMGNALHMHDNRVEAFYVVSGTGGQSIADSKNHAVREVIVPAGGVGHKPMNVYHRQYNPADPTDPDAEDCFWIHSMVVFTHRGSRLPQIHLRMHELDGKSPLWPNTNQL